MIFIGVILALTQGMLWGVCTLFALRVFAGRGTWGHREALAFVLCTALAAGCGHLARETRQEHDRMTAYRDQTMRGLDAYDERLPGRVAELTRRHF